jgi:preprotein translocase subunit SecA
MARARMTGGNGASGGAGAAGAGQARPGFTPSGARIGRNDACWCGSGLKYKKCHGR